MTETGYNEFGYYIQFADGFLIQSGHIEGYYELLTVTFPKAFKTRNYSFIRTSLFNGTNSDAYIESWYQGAQISNRTESTIQFHIGHYAIGSEWLAMGY